MFWSTSTRAHGDKSSVAYMIIPMIATCCRRVLAADVAREVRMRETIDIMSAPTATGLGAGVEAICADRVQTKDAGA